MKRLLRQSAVEEVARENETGYLPTLKTKIERIEQYLPGLPYLGNPIQHECGLRRRSSFQTVREHCPQSTVVQGFVIRADWKRWTISVIKRSKGGGSTERS